MLIGITVRGLQISPQFVISAGLPWSRFTVLDYQRLLKGSGSFDVLAVVSFSASLDNMGFWRHASELLHGGRPRTQIWRFASASAVSDTPSPMYLLDRSR